MQNVDRLRTPWIAKIALAVLLAPLTSTAADGGTIECRARFHLDDNHNVVIAWENFQVPLRSGEAGANELRLKLYDDYKRALKDHPPAGTEGLQPYWSGTECTYAGIRQDGTLLLESRTGSIVNGYGATTTFVKTDWLRGGKGYLASGAPKPKPPIKNVGTASGASHKPPALTITAPKPASQDWTPEQLARANEASAEKARSAAQVLKNEKKLQEDLRKFWEDKRRRGRSQ